MFWFRTRKVRSFAAVLALFALAVQGLVATGHAARMAADTAGARLALSALADLGFDTAGAICHGGGDPASGSGAPQDHGKTCPICLAGVCHTPVADGAHEAADLAPLGSRSPAYYGFDDRPGTAPPHRGFYARGPPARA
ncbi:MAG: hypothetical protein NW216_08485 [Hyphomicrobium sp.]|nr:hypothetical protein [Hyphomicrobium sp.]